MADLQRRKEEVMAKMRAARPDGHVPAQWDYTASIDPDYLEVFNELYKQVMLRDSALPLKIKEIIVGCLLAARSYGERVPLHVERAMAAGATEAEILDGFEVAGLLSGVPTVLIGVEALSAVAARRKEGKFIWQVSARNGRRLAVAPGITKSACAD